MSGFSINSLYTVYIIIQYIIFIDILCIIFSRINFQSHVSYHCPFSLKLNSVKTCYTQSGADWLVGFLITTLLAPWRSAWTYRSPKTSPHCLPYSISKLQRISYLYFNVIISLPCFKRGRSATGSPQLSSTEKVSESNYSIIITTTPAASTLLSPRFLY